MSFHLESHSQWHLVIVDLAPTGTQDVFTTACLYSANYTSSLSIILLHSCKCTLTFCSKEIVSLYSVDQYNIIVHLSFQGVLYKPFQLLTHDLSTSVAILLHFHSYFTIAQLMLFYKYIIHNVIHPSAQIVHKPVPYSSQWCILLQPSFQQKFPRTLAIYNHVIIIIQTIIYLHHVAPGCKAILMVTLSMTDI